MKNAIEKTIKDLVEKASKDKTSIEALQRTQAVLNLAKSLESIKYANEVKK